MFNVWLQTENAANAGAALSTSQFLVQEDAGQGLRSLAVCQAPEVWTARAIPFKALARFGYLVEFAGFYNAAKARAGHRRERPSPAAGEAGAKWRQLC